MKAFWHDRQGSVLMETVLVIPLYLVLLSGVFWLGDLSLLRAKTTFFDRLAAWSSGNRHEKNSGSPAEQLEQDFLNPAQVGKQEVESVRTDSAASGDAWSRIAGATVKAALEPPVWTQSWRSGGSLMLEGGRSGGNGKLQRTSLRSREIEAEWMHRVLMRSSQTYREEVTPQTLAEKVEWRSRVYDASWPSEWSGEQNSPVSGGSPCLEYERHQAYVQWSE